jgi:hypothetical protein
MQGHVLHAALLLALALAQAYLLARRPGRLQWRPLVASFSLGLLLFFSAAHCSPYNPHLHLQPGRSASSAPCCAPQLPGTMQPVGEQRVTRVLYEVEAPSYGISVASPVPSMASRAPPVYG